MSVRTYGFEDIGYHTEMLLDKVRVAAYARALKEIVRPDDVVADVGAGSGILAAIAAKCGARQVYAIERGPLAELAERVMAENDLQDRVTVFRVDAREVVFPEPPNILVSETLGNFGMDEDIIGLFGLLRSQCDPEVRLIPSGFEVFLSLLSDTGLNAELDALRSIQGVSMNILRNRLVHRVAATRIGIDEVCGNPLGTGWIELSNATVPQQVCAVFRVDSPREINAVGAWFEAALSPGVRLSTGPEHASTSWPNLKFPLDPPLMCAAGQEVKVTILPRLTVGGGIWAWEVRCGNEHRSGDSMNASCGGIYDVLDQLGVGIKSKGDRKDSQRLEAWAAIFGGSADGTVPELSEKLLRAFPEQYFNIEDAGQEVIRLLKSADALS